MHCIVYEGVEDTFVKCWSGAGHFDICIISHGISDR